eukprot:282117_1
MMEKNEKYKILCKLYLLYSNLMQMLLLINHINVFNVMNGILMRYKLDKDPFCYSSTFINSINTLIFYEKLSILMILQHYFKAIMIITSKTILKMKQQHQIMYSMVKNNTNLHFSICKCIDEIIKSIHFNNELIKKQRKYIFLFLKFYFKITSIIIATFYTETHNKFANDFDYNINVNTPASICTSDNINYGIYNNRLKMASINVVNTSVKLNEGFFVYHLNYMTYANYWINIIYINDINVHCINLKIITHVKYWIS